MLIIQNTYGSRILGAIIPRGVINIMEAGNNKLSVQSVPASGQQILSNNEKVTIYNSQKLIASIVRSVNE